MLLAYNGYINKTQIVYKAMAVKQQLWKFGFEEGILGLPQTYEIKYQTIEKLIQRGTRCKDPYILKYIISKG